ncbi:hypothetical protein E1B28_013138 [Marasmius oreades]|uniref:Carboxylic ester hydrolase n=1 Tax=Marasmius oreades TaxID=181124 RepID=A0A9P7RPV5_9AGAR|nr:uncharacterized protein E1B28_013138 [Marasmius oreades]KAG7087158.1 hypothetical protein E1B28_013138 [Marasmius oreades]
MNIMPMPMLAFRNRFLCLLTLSLALLTSVFGQSQPPSVTLDYGTFIGVKDTTTNITSYRGVRYADAPTGGLRWRAAVSPPSKNLGTVNATKFANTCIMNSIITAGSAEDCLFGNLYIPAVSGSSTPLPVLVWFHGGGFVSGSSHDANPVPIFATTREPMILVSFEYRLGPFGFLAGSAIKNDGLPNAGLHDQRTALRWVQRYIGKFGGDPSRVTIWGESAGAGSTMFHLLANDGNPEGLFRAAIGDSPSLNQMPSTTDDFLETLFRAFATAAGCNDLSLSCLRSSNIATLASAGAKVIQSRPATLFLFAPHFDGEFITNRPVEGFRNGKIARVPVIFGANTNEGAHWSSTISDPNANTSMPNATQDTVYNFIGGQYPNFSRESFNEAVSLYPLQEFNGSFELQGQQMYGEARYICTAQMIAAGTAAVNRNSFQFHYNNGHLGSDHSAELAAFWDGDPSGADVNDRKLFEGMREFWSSFVTSGTQPQSTIANWKSTDKDGIQRMLLDPSRPGMENITPKQVERCTFWHSISGEINT